MINFSTKFYALISLIVAMIFVMPLVASAADGDDFSTSADYYINQQRTGVTEFDASSADYVIKGELGAPGVGEATSADYVFNNGTIWRYSGTLSLEIVDASYDPVDTPVVTMGGVTFSFTSQTSTGTLGADSERVYWENFDAADTSGYSITIAATGGDTSIWDGAGVTDYDYNDDSDDVDGGDADAFGGQLTIDPSVGTITARPDYGSTTGISVAGSPVAFNETVGPVSSITLVTASGASDDYHAAYLTGVGLSQSIPASQPADTYTISMTLTIA